jgi:protein-S-isoprenylcysteine O-methyltransferase Ste14
MIYFIVFIGLFFLRIFVEILVQPKKGVTLNQGKRKGLFSLLLLTNCYVISVISVVYFLLKVENVSLTSYIVGVLLLVIGTGGRVKALRDLGNNYSQFIECVPFGRLVTTGMYSTIRHPLYLFYIIEMSGFLAIRYSFISLAALIIVILSVIYRIKAEESALSKTFGKEFKAYRQRTKYLIPFIF